MKLLKLTSLGFLLVAFSLTSFSQQKKDNLITVTVIDSSNLRTKVENLLKAEGYKLNKLAENSDYVATEGKTIGKYYRTLCNYLFKIDGNTIVITGNWFFSHYEHGKIAFHKSSSFLPGWKEMDRLAKLLGAVSYSVQSETESK